MLLYHFYEKGTPPFRNLSDLSEAQADAVLQEIRRTRPQSKCAARPADYVARRLRCERILRAEFEKKGGKIERRAPHYLTIGFSPWLSTWFGECACVCIPLEEFDLRTVSFTYGDSHPTFSPKPIDQKEYRQKLYTYEEILGLIDRYGLPQDWNDDGRHGPERYIEAQVWSDETIRRYCHAQ